MTLDPRYEACRILEAVLKAHVPYDTGNLFQNGIRIGDYGTCPAIYIGGEVAEYAPYTNEPWTAKRWHGAKNPNEGWIERALEEAMPLIQRALSDRLTEEDIAEIIKEYTDIHDERMKSRIDYTEQRRTDI